MSTYTRREMLGLTAGSVLGAATLNLASAEKTASADKASIKTRVFWTWDHSTEWALNRTGAQNMGAANPYMRDTAAFLEDYTKLLNWAGGHHIDAVVIWGLLR